MENAASKEREVPKYKSPLFQHQFRPTYIYLFPSLFSSNSSKRVGIEEVASGARVEQVFSLSDWSLSIHFSIAYKSSSRYTFRCIPTMLVWRYWRGTGKRWMLYLKNLYSVIYHNILLQPCYIPLIPSLIRSTGSRSITPPESCWARIRRFSCWSTRHDPLWETERRQSITVIILPPRTIRKSLQLENSGSNQEILPR